MRRGGYLLQAVEAALKKLARALAAGHGIVGVARGKARMFGRVARCHLLIAESLEYPEGTFAQARLPDDCVAGHFGDFRSRVPRTRKIAAVKCRKVLARHALAHRLRLRAANVGQRGVGLPLHAAFAIPRGFTMTNQDQFGAFIHAALRLIKFNKIM